MTTNNQNYDAIGKTRVFSFSFWSHQKSLTERKERIYTMLGFCGSSFVHGRTLKIIV
jgi:hypothetical protein